MHLHRLFLLNPQQIKNVRYLTIVIANERKRSLAIHNVKQISLIINWIATLRLSPYS